MRWSHLDEPCYWKWFNFRAETVWIKWEDDEKPIEEVMGFSSFGHKKARQFDFMKMVEESKKLAKERVQQNKPDESSENAPSKVYTVSREQDSTSDTQKPSSSNDQQASIDKNIKEGNEDEDEEEYDDDEVDEAVSDYFTPLEMELNLVHGDKPVTALAVDHAGGRLLTGGLDFNVRWWDFVGMDQSALRPFKTQQPMASHQIRQLDFSCNGELILVVGGNAQAKVLTRDGVEVAECVKGYQYITNPSSAKGHTHQLTGGSFHPRERDEFLTSSLDGTLRVWDVTTAETLNFETRIPEHRICMKLRGDQGKRTMATTCCYSGDGALIGGAGQDGSLQFWDHRRKVYVNHAFLVRNAHAANTDIGGLCFSYDARQFVSRAMDDSMKLWDVRQLKAPVHAIRGLPTLFPETNCVFSPNDKLLVTGISVRGKGDTAAKVLFYSRDTGQLVKEHETLHQSVVSVAWHPRINQLILGHADGAVTVHYDSRHSHNGAKLSTLRTKSNRKMRQSRAHDDGYAKPVLLTYDEETERAARKGWRYSKFNEIDRVRPDPKKMVPSRPESVVTQSNKGGSLHQYMVQQIVLPKCEDPAEKDIRGAILRHADDAAKNPFWLKAYNKTQPKPIFQNVEEEQDDTKAPMWKKPKMS